MRKGSVRVVNEDWYGYIKERYGNIKELSEELSFAVWKRFWGGLRLEQPIFMIGCPRSGTSVAARLFGLHPDVTNFSEAGEIWDPRHYYDPEVDHYWTASDVTPEDIGRLHDRFEFHRRLKRAKRLINKHPRNSVRIDYVRAIFPDAVFIHIIRDGRAVVRSIVESTKRDPSRQRIPMGRFCKPPNWRDLLRNDPVEQAALQWREVVLHILTKRQELGESYHELKYEDLCQDCRGVLGDAFAFAKLHNGVDVLELLPERLGSQNFKWQRSLDQEQIETINRIQAPLLREFGYGL